ncbi:MAG: hypothetical protein AB7S78_08460 [Candidatus Omnitrophota bacterium]
MKIFKIIILAVIFGIYSGQMVMAADAPDTKEELMDRFKTGISQKDVDGLYGLFYMEGVSEETKSQMKNALEVLVDSEISDYHFGEVPEDYNPVRLTMNGIKMTPNLTVEGFIKFNIKSAEGWEGNGSQPYGFNDGAYYLPGTLIK